MQDAPEAPLAPNQTTDCCLAIHNTMAFHPSGLGPESVPGFSYPPGQKQTFPKTSVGSLPTPNAQLRGASLPCLSSRSEEHTSELQSRENIVCRLLLEKKNKGT